MESHASNISNLRFSISPVLVGRQKPLDSRAAREARGVQGGRRRRQEASLARDRARRAGRTGHPRFRTRPQQKILQIALGGASRAAALTERAADSVAKDLRQVAFDAA